VYLVWIVCAFFSLVVLIIIGLRLFYFVFHFLVFIVCFMLAFLFLKIGFLDLLWNSLVVLSWIVFFFNSCFYLSIFSVISLFREFIILVSDYCVEFSFLIINSDNSFLNYNNLFVKSFSKFVYNNFYYS